MIVAVYLCAVGLAAGFLLLWRVPTCGDGRLNSETSVSVIIPARNEEHNLPRLLKSISFSGSQKIETLVVNDHSTDATAEVAREMGARVVGSELLPPGWTGKAWACHQGAQQASGQLLLFVDADTYFAPRGLERLVARWKQAADRQLTISLLPYHTLGKSYEQLSLIFYLLMAAGAGGFGLIARARLFGQSLLIPRDVYFAVGGHSSVRGSILENLNLAEVLHKVGRRMLCLGGRGTLEIHMFPDGFTQMSDSWTKAFVCGASSSGGAVLACSIAWISTLWTVALMLFVLSAIAPSGFFLVYCLFSLQLFLIARQLGDYSFLVCLMYPIPLAYYCVIFARSAFRRAAGQKTIWRGRAV
jgi:4,4'-diaponeurosporenoate glycosyltransferase